MASESKGLKKRHSAAQKLRYKAHPFKLLANKITRLERYIRRNAYDVARKARRGHEINTDQQAVNALKRLTTNV